MFKKTFVLAIVAMVAMGASLAYSWDGERQGFILGGGLGVGAVTWDQEVDLFGLSLSMDPETDFAVVTDFKIGYAFNNQIMLYYFDKAGWFSMENILNDNVIIASGLSGFGASYYFNDAAPSLVLGGGLGLASWSAPFEDGNDPWYGFGATVGVGYEFMPHLGVNLDFVWGTASDNEPDIDVTTQAYAFLLTFNVTGY